jgi:hypothetical protein
MTRGTYLRFLARLGELRGIELRAHGKNRRRRGGEYENLEDIGHKYPKKNGYPV